MDFTTPADPRPSDVVWPAMIWPVPAQTVLQGEVVELRPSVHDDAAGLFEALDASEVWSHVRGRPTSVAAWEERIASDADDPTLQRFTVRRRELVGGAASSEIVGSTCFLDTSVIDARTEIGSTTYSPSVWGSLVNPETKLLLLEFAFDMLACGRVQLKTDIRNQRSQRAIDRLGASYEGVLRRHMRREDGSVRDTILFSVTADDWPEVRAGLLSRLSASGTRPS